jgi:hypothetical protein
MIHIPTVEEHIKRLQGIYDFWGHGKFIEWVATEFRQMQIQNLGADAIDDHTSCWGGAGPDCPIGRREAALTY